MDVSRDEERRQADWPDMCCSDLRPAFSLAAKLHAWTAEYPDEGRPSPPKSEASERRDKKTWPAGYKEAVSVSV